MFPAERSAADRPTAFKNKTARDYLPGCSIAISQPVPPSLCVSGPTSCGSLRPYGQRLAVSSHPAARTGCGLGMVAGGTVTRCGCGPFTAVGSTEAFTASAIEDSFSSESRGATSRKASTSFSNRVSSISFCRRTSYTFFIGAPAPCSPGLNRPDYAGLTWATRFWALVQNACNFPHFSRIPCTVKGFQAFHPVSGEMLDRKDLTQQRIEKNDSGGSRGCGQNRANNVFVPAQKRPLGLDSRAQNQLRLGIGPGCPTLSLP